MPYCIHCGKESLESARYCTRCGKLLFRPAAQPAAETEAKEVSVVPESPVPQKGSFALLLIAGLVGLAIAGSFIFSGKEETVSRKREKPPDAMLQEMPVEAMPADTGLTEAPIAVPDSSTTPVDTPEPYHTPGLQPNHGNGYLSDVVVGRISRIVASVFEAENNGSFNSMLDHFSFPVIRFYERTNASYTASQQYLQNDRFRNLSYHHFSIDFARSQIEKSGANYQVNLYGQYIFRTRQLPREASIQTRNLSILLNSDFRIISLREI